MKRIDLHVHTTASDSTASPAEAVRLAKMYDGDEAGAFTNGILGAFARSLPQEGA